MQAKGCKAVKMQNIRIAFYPFFAPLRYTYGSVVQRGYLSGRGLPFRTFFCFGRFDKLQCTTQNKSGLRRGRYVSRKRLAQHTSRLCAQQPLDDLAAFEDIQRRDARDAEALCRTRVLIDIQLGDQRAAGKLLRQPLDCRCHGPARPTPRRPSTGM